MVIIPAFQRFLLVVACLLVVAWPAYAQSEHPAFEAKGAHRGHEYFGQLPEENIDTLNGNLFLSFTDLALLGNAGLDLRIQRSYNSKNLRGWAFGLAGLPMKVLNAEAQPAWWPAEAIRLPQIVWADEGEHEATPYGHSADTNFVTREFWLYDRTTHQVRMPNGWIATFDELDARDSDPVVNPAGRNVRYLTEVRDPFGNTIKVTYFVKPNRHVVEKISQVLGEGKVREITFEYEDDGRDSVRSMTYDGRTWTYQYTTGSVGELLMSAVVPPVGPGWSFGYTNSELTSVTTPQGGAVGYEYETHTFSFQEQCGRGARPCETPVIGTKASRVVKRRAVGGRGIQAGEWTYKYSELLATDKQTIIEGPTSVVTVHYAFKGQEWAIDWRKTADHDEHVLELEEKQYQYVQYDTWSPFPVSSQPVVSSRSVTRYLSPGSSGQTSRSWSTTFAYNVADYDQPWKITESGDFTRTTTRTFEYLITGFRKPPVKTETVEEQGRSTATSFGFDLATGFLTSETHDGVTVTYDKDAAGNRKSAQDAVPGHPAATAEYEWGVPKKMTTAAGVLVERSINGDG